MKMMIRPAKITHSMLLDLAKRAREDHERKNADGTEFIRRTPMVTGKGQRYFISKFLETKDAEALAAITEEELKLQSETNLFAEDFQPQLTAEELNSLDAEAQAVGNNLAAAEELEDIEHEDLEDIDVTEELEDWDDASEDLEALNNNGGKA